MDRPICVPGAELAADVAVGLVEIHTLWTILSSVLAVSTQSSSFDDFHNLVRQKRDSVIGRSFHPPLTLVLPFATARVSSPMAFFASAIFV